MYVKRPYSAASARAPIPPAAGPNLHFQQKSGRTQQVLIYNSGARTSSRTRKQQLEKMIASEAKRCIVVPVEPNITATATHTHTHAKFSDAAEADAEREAQFLRHGSPSHNVQIFASLQEGVEQQKECYNSFAVACEAALAHVRAATKELPRPNGLEVSVASMLLMKLSHAVGPAYGALLRKLLRFVFDATFEGVQLPSEEEEEKSQRLTGRPLDYSCFINSKLFVHRNEHLSDTVDRLQLRNDRLRISQQKMKSTVTHFIDRCRKEMLGLFFGTWKRFVKTRAKANARWLRLFSSARAQARKESCFYKWITYAQWSREHKNTELISKNHDMLNGRVNELFLRCSAREEEVQKQRSAKERIHSKAALLEEQLSTEKIECSKAKTATRALEAENSELLELASAAVRQLEVMQPQLASAPTKLLEGASRSAPLLSTASRGAGTVVISSGTASSFFDALGSTKKAGLSIPPVAPHIGSSFGSAQIPNVRYFLVGWLNGVIREERAASEARQRRAAMMGGNPDEAAESAEMAKYLRELPAKVTKLQRNELGDCRVYLLLLWKMLKNQDEKNSTPVPPFCQSDAERAATVIAMALYVGVDGGCTASELLSADDGFVHLAFTCRLFARYVSVIPSQLVLDRLKHGEKSVQGLTSRLGAARERLAHAKRWQELAVCVGNYVQKIWSTRCTQGSTTFLTLLAEDAYCFDLGVIRELVPRERLAYAGPAAIGGTDSLEDECLSFFANAAQNILVASKPQLESACAHYAASAATDFGIVGCVDFAGWSHMVADTHLIVNKLTTKAQAENVFRSCATVRGSSSALDKLQASSPKVTSPGKGGGQSEPTNALIPPSSFPLALLKLFLVSSSEALQWKNVDDGVERFKQFFNDSVLPKLQVLSTEHVEAAFNSIAVQEVFTVFKDQLKKIFADMSSRSIDTPGRVKCELFSNFVTKELKLLDAPQSMFLFCVSRQLAIAYGGDGSSANSTGPVLGMDYTSFQFALVILCRVKYGYPLMGYHEGLRSFLTTCLFPLYQFRLKLKF